MLLKNFQNEKKNCSGSSNGSKKCTCIGFISLGCNVFIEWDSQTHYPCGIELKLKSKAQSLRAYVLSHRAQRRMLSGNRAHCVDWPHSLCGVHRYAQRQAHLYRIPLTPSYSLRCAHRYSRHANDHDCERTNNQTSGEFAKRAVCHSFVFEIIRCSKKGEIWMETFERWNWVEECECFYEEHIRVLFNSMRNSL